MDAFFDDLKVGALDNTDGILDSALGQLGANNPSLLGTIPNQAIQAVAAGTGAGASVLEIGRIELTVDAAELAVSDTRSISATVFPRTTANMNLNWTTDRPDILAVNPAGVVTAVSPGSAVVTATSQADGNISESILISVRDDSGAVPDPLEDISLVAPTTLVRGESSNAIVAPIPATALLRDVTWSTSNAEIVSIASGGRISALSVGTATITATSNGISKSVDIQITTPDLQGIVMSGPDQVVAGSSLTLNVQPIPGDAVFGAVQWSTDNPAIANVAAGLVTGVSAGQATITATVGSFSDNKLIDVIPPTVSALRISGVTSLQLGAGTVQLTAVASPQNADTGILTWSSDNPEIASVNDNGVVVGNSVGQTSIRVKSSTNAGIEGVVTVTVTAPPPPALTGLSISGPSSVTLEVGGSLDLNVASVEGIVTVTVNA
ncbi:Ig-like domain-containing protein, partial [Allohahella marinimesophila]|uniref:Ig-like domain-containing protein n=1 Tax=Allohahella marinimesophila TaxID=1054972 RepID=UPI003CD07F75